MPRLRSRAIYTTFTVREYSICLSYKNSVIYPKFSKKILTFNFTSQNMSVWNLKTDLNDEAFGSYDVTHNICLGGLQVICTTHLKNVWW